MNFTLALLSIWHQFRDHPFTLSLFAFLGSILAFILESSQSVGVIFVGLFIMIAANTWSGILRARKEKRFDKQVLKSKTMNKIIAYCTLLFIVAIATIVVFAFTYKGKESFVDNYYLRMPLMICELFFVGIELLSAADNIDATYGVNLPPIFRKRVEKFINEDQNIDDLLKKP